MNRTRGPVFLAVGSDEKGMRGRKKIFPRPVSTGRRDFHSHPRREHRFAVDGGIRSTGRGGLPLPLEVAISSWEG